MQIVPPLQQLDEKILMRVQRVRSVYLTQIMLQLTHSGTGRSWFIFALVLNAFHWAGFQFAVRQADFIRALFCPLLAWGLGSLLKRIFKRERPSEKKEGYVRLIESPTCGSFPSSHAAASFAFYAGLVLLGHPLAAVVGVWAVAVSFSRIYLGVHYLSDILGGTAVGVFAAYIITYVLPFLPGRGVL